MTTEMSFIITMLNSTMLDMEKCDDEHYRFKSLSLRQTPYFILIFIVKVNEP